jgi:hypothetical protein
MWPGLPKLHSLSPGTSKPSYLFTAFADELHNAPHHCLHCAWVRRSLMLMSACSWCPQTQHLGSKHGGINSEDAKYLVLRNAAQQTATSSSGPPPAGSTSGGVTKHTSTARAREQAAAKRGPTRQPVTFAQILTAPSTSTGQAQAPKPAAWGRAAQPGASQQPATAAPTPPAPATQARASTLKQQPKQSSTATATAGSRRRAASVITFGTLLRVPAPAKKAPPARPGVTGTAVTGRQVVALPKGRRRLQREGEATRKKRPSTVKRKVLKERAAKSLADAQAALSRAIRSADEVNRLRAKLQAELAAAQATTTSGSPITSSGQSGDGSAGTADSTAGAPSPAAGVPQAQGLILPPDMPAHVRSAVLQLSLQRLQPKVLAAQAAVIAAEASVAAAQAAYNKAHNIPEPTPDLAEAVQTSTGGAARAPEQQGPEQPHAPLQHGSAGAQSIQPAGDVHVLQQGTPAAQPSTSGGPAEPTAAKPAAGPALQEREGSDDDSSDTDGSSSWEEEEDSDDDGGRTRTCFACSDYQVLFNCYHKCLLQQCLQTFIDQFSSAQLAVCYMAMLQVEH